MAVTTLLTTVSTKGQVILPKAVRDHMHWEPGTRLSVEETTDGVLLRVVATQFAPTNPDEVFGSLNYQGEPKSIEEMHTGIVAEAERRGARGRY
jgi:AbrB family looped-hinge helix DNA binding protein